MDTNIRLSISSSIERIHIHHQTLKQAIAMLLHTAITNRLTRIKIYHSDPCIEFFRHCIELFDKSTVLVTSVNCPYSFGDMQPSYSWTKSLLYWMHALALQRSPFNGMYSLALEKTQFQGMHALAHREENAARIACAGKTKRLAVSCFRSVSKASTSGPLHTLTSEFGWDLVLMCGIWPIA